MVITINLRKKLTYLLIFSFFSLLALLPYSVQAQDYKVKTVVIDAGHGGHDPGARGPGGNLEKQVTLKVALLLGKKIQSEFKDVKVIYTRTTDVFVPLHERASIANKNNADLFISIHCNSHSNKSAYGTETFVLGQHRTDDQYEVAKRENSVIALESGTEDMYGGYDPNAPETMILISLNLNAYLEQSMLYADKVQKQYTNILKRQNRGVKQAGFAVLYRTTMPSVLTEIGFISNPQEEKYIASTKGQDDIAKSLLNAFKAYKSAMEESKGSVLTTIDSAELTQPAEEIQTPSEVELTNEIVYKVQLAVTSKTVDTRKLPYSNFRNIYYELQDNLYKYMVGNHTDLQAAQQELANVKKRGFPDAFIVIYKGGKRLSPSEAKMYLQ